MDTTGNRTRARRGVAALALAVTLAAGATALGGTAFGGGVAAADPDSFTSGGSGPVAIGANPALVRWVRAVGTCSEMYPRGTDISACIANLY